MTVGSLFSGIGGFDLGLERAGMDIRWQVERDPWCQKILAKHWPDVPRYTNVEDVGSNLQCVDLICGGFPCQPVSVAGQRQGTADDRWLWPEFQRIVGLLRPRYVLVENVPGLFTANGGHAFGEIIGDLADLGYDCEWTVLSAADVGAPHLRKRVWIVADADQPRESADAGVHRRDEGEPEGNTRTPLFAGSEVALSTHSESGCAYMADAESVNGEWAKPEGNRGWRSQKTARDSGESRVTLADADHEGQSSRTVYAIEGTSLSEFTSSHQWWLTEPDVGRVADGVPRRVDRLKGLGNAIVPQCAEWIGRQLLT